MLKEIIRVQQILNDAQVRTRLFQHDGHLNCLSHCCHCCQKTDLLASPLEFLPLAYHLYKTARAEQFYDRLRQLPANQYCALLDFESTNHGQCHEYAYRGLICRLFGFAANLDKNSRRRLISCRSIKESNGYLHLGTTLDQAPLFGNFYFRLEAVDFSLAGEQLQINEALRKAIEIVLTYFQFRDHFHRA